jgi:hypothetical protein
LSLDTIILLTLYKFYYSIYSDNFSSGALLNCDVAHHSNIKATSMTDHLRSVRAPVRVDAFDLLSDFDAARTAVQRLAAAARLQATEQARSAAHPGAERAEVLRAWRIANDVLGTVLNEVEITMAHLERRTIEAARIL